MFFSALIFSFEHFSTLFCYLWPGLLGVLAVDDPLLALPCFGCCEPAAQHPSPITGAFGSDSFRGLGAGTNAQLLSQRNQFVSLLLGELRDSSFRFLSFASALFDPNANTSHINPVPGCLDPGWVCASYSLVPAWPFFWYLELVS